MNTGVATSPLSDAELTRAAQAGDAGHWERCSPGTRRTCVRWLWA
jgi:hypothetical protein